jgi:uncharacterized protein (DUF433 family)
LTMDIQTDYHQYGESIDNIVQNYPYVHPNVIASIL